MSDINSLEYSVFRTSFDKLVNGIQHDVENVARKAFGCKLISQQWLSILTSRDKDEEHRATKLLDIVLTRIKQNSTHFETFVSILQSVPTLEELADELVEILDLTRNDTRTCISNSKESVSQNIVSEQTALITDSVSQTFTLLLSKCLASLESKEIPPKALVNTILCLKLFDSDDSDESLVVDCKNDLQQATSNAAIFELVKPYMSYLNPELLAHIISKYLDSDNDRKEYKDYMKALEEYCKVTQVVLPCQPDETMPAEYESLFKKLNIVIETPIMNLVTAREIKLKLAKVLKLNVAALQIKLAGESPLTIAFQLSEFVCKKIFPLSISQERELKGFGVLSLGCGVCKVSNEGEIEMPGLGRPFQLGMLYDCRNDNIIHDAKICTDDILESCVEEKPHIWSIGKIIPADTLAIKARSPGLTPDHKLSLMAGLINDISGAALYWNNPAASKHKVRVCVLFESTKYNKLLPVNKLHQIVTQQFPADLATHVVTEIVYGIDTYLIVECDVREGENHKDVHDEIGSVLTTCGIAGDQFGNLNKETPHDLLQRNAVCTVYSDISPTKQCLTLYDGIQMFKCLLQQASNNDLETEKMVPKMVTLHPLRMLNDRYNVVVQPISLQTADLLQSVVENIMELDIQANDIQSIYSDVTSKFPHLDKQLKEFREKLMKHKTAIVEFIAAKLPQVRGGSNKEMDLIKTVEESSASPFNFPALHSWLKQKDEEASVLALFTKKLKGITFVSSSELISAETDGVICFAFNVGSVADPVLQSMELYNSSRFESNSAPLQSTTLETPRIPWYKDTSIVKIIHIEADHFKQFWYTNQNRTSVKLVATCATVDSSISQFDKPVGIFLIEDGTPRKWEPPGPPGKPLATVLSHTLTSVKLVWSKPDRGSENIECYTISYCPTDSTSWKKWTTNSDDESEVLTDLDSDVEYIFKVQAQCTKGLAVSTESELSNPVITTSLPTVHEKSHCEIVLHHLNVTHNSVLLKWAEPECGSEKIDGYTIFYSSPDDECQSWKRVFTESCEHCVRNLNENTRYVFKVRAEFNGGGISKDSEISGPVPTKCRSLSHEPGTSVTPVNEHLRPGKPEATKVTHDSISLSWAPPSQNTSDIQLYIVSYRPLNDPDDLWYRHSENHDVTSIVVCSLSSDTEYIFKVHPEFKTAGVLGAESEISDRIKTKIRCQPGSPKPVTVTQTSIYLKWEQPELGIDIIEHYEVTCHLINQDGKTRFKKMETSGKNPHLQIKCLKPKSMYTFKVKPVVSQTDDCCCLESSWSEKIKTAATSCPTELSPVAVTHNSIHLKWSKPTACTEEITRYIVFYQQNDVLLEPDNSKETNITLCNLSSATTYTIKVQPVCKSGWLGTESECMTIETEATSPPGVPIVNKSLPITHDSIPLKWTEPKHGCEHIDHYVISYHEQDDSSQVMMKFTTGRQTDIVMNDLKPGVKYCFSVQCKCAKGKGGKSTKWSDPISTKPSSAPGKPSVVYDQVSNENVTLQWKPPEFGSENIKSFSVFGRKTSKNPPRCDQLAKTSGNETECEVKGLDMFTEYVFHICPEYSRKNSCDYGCPSEESDPVKTKPTSAPKSVQAKSKYTTHNSIILTWKPPDKNAQPIKHYTILYCKESEQNSKSWISIEFQPAHVLPQSDCEYTITDLCANTSYVFKVRPECDVGSGTESKVSRPEITKPVCQCGKPEPTSVTHDSITWKWTKPAHDTKNVMYYKVWYKVQYQDSWKEKEMQLSNPTIKLDRLTLNTEYALKVQPHMQSTVSTECKAIESDFAKTKSTSPPGKPKASAITHDTIHLEWDKPKFGSDKLSQYCLQYWCLNTTSHDMIQATTEHNSMLVKNLIPEGKYEFCVKSECHIGEGAEGERSDPIQTKATSQPGKPIATKVTHDSVSLEWTKPKVIGSLGSYSVTCLDLKSQAEFTVSVHKILSSTVINGLEPNTQYQFKIEPNGKTGTGEESEPSDIITTKQVCKTDKPIVISVTHSSIHLKWNKPEFTGSGRIQYYSVSYWPTGGDNSTPNDAVSTLTTDGAFEEITLQELSTNKVYCCEITPKLQSDEETACVASVSDPIKTKATSEPGKPKAVKRTLDSIELQWTTPERGSENVEYYMVYFCLTNDPEQELNRYPGPKLSTSESRKPVQTLKINDLQPNSSYIFQVHPDCKRGSEGTDSCFSEPISTTCTSSPGNLKTTAVTHNSMKLQWTKPEYGSDTIMHYVVSYCTANEHTVDNINNWTSKKTTADETEITLTGLDTFTNYFFNVRPECTNGDGAMYECSEPTQTKATSSPGQPQCVNVTHNSIEIAWTTPKYGSENVGKYIVSYFPLGQHEHEKKEECATTNLKVDGLCSNTAYIFKVHPVCSQGVSTDSAYSEEIKTHPCCQPGQITCKSKTHSSIQIVWTKPEFGVVDSYNVKCYQEVDRRHEIEQQTIGSSNDLSAEFKGLEVKSWYMFEVVPQCSANNIMENIGIESAWSALIETPNKPLAERMRSKSKRIAEGPPAIYKVPVEYDMKEEQHKIAICHIGKCPANPTDEKVLMVVGATGAGKTTLINGITNCIFNVQWEDDFRFKLVTDENPGKDQTHSQTSWITAYTFYPTEGSRIDYTLTIIDTPGFGDCGGLERDRRITTQMKKFLSHIIVPPYRISDIHGIGFVTQSSLARLTPTQKYIFDSILAIFGKNIAENILMMCTFADGQLPPVLAAVKAANVPGGERHFKFNNSALFANFKVDESDKSDESDELNFDKMFWKMGNKSFESFFKYFQAAPSQSLQMTRQVMEDREQLEFLVERFHQQIKMGLGMIDELQQEEQVLRDHQRDIEANKDFQYEVKVTRYDTVKLDPGKYVTNCKTCHLTCHDDCTIENDDEKYECKAMGWFWQKGKDAHCKVCPKKCHWRQHTRETDNEKQVAYCNQCNVACHIGCTVKSDDEMYECRAMGWWFWQRREDAHCKVCPGKCHWQQHVNQDYCYKPKEAIETRTFEHLKARYDEAVGGKTRVEQMISKNEQDLEELRGAVLDLVREMKEKQERLQEIALKPNFLTEESYIEILIETERQEAEAGFEKRIASLKMIKDQVKLISAATIVGNTEEMNEAQGKSWWQIWKKYF